MKDIILVVPTIRESCIKDFLERWNNIGLREIVDIIVMEDHESKEFDIEDVDYHLCWKDIKRHFGSDEWIIPRNSDTVRSFAYWYAWSLGYKYILTLDDDCYPEYTHAAQFINEHLKFLNGRSKWMSTLNSAKPRGLPYYNVGLRDDVIVNHGLWTNVLDYDAPTQLANPVQENFDYSNRLVPRGTYFPMCGMNVMWKGGYTPLMYHLLMGKMINRAAGNLQRLPFDRFGDIWCGILMKKCADLLTKVVSTGTPYIRHERASNPFTNLIKEANGIEVNEKFWEIVDNVELPFSVHSADSPSAVYQSLAAELKKTLPKAFPQYSEYFEDLTDAMSLWSKKF